MAIIFSLLMSLGLISNNSSVDSGHMGPHKFDNPYADYSKGGIEWEESH